MDAMFGFDSGAWVLGPLVVAVCFILAVPVGTPVVRALLRRLDRAAKSKQEGSHGAMTGLEAADAALPGGYWIGLLERTALFACVLSGFPAGIAVVLGVKSIGRYPELRTRTGHLGELFIIGTFASMLWAALFAGIAHAAVWLW